MTYKMLEMSTAHLAKKTREWLTTKECGLIAYEKQFEDESYGWFVFVPDKDDVQDIVKNFNIPKDIRNILSYASSKKFNWLMFDRDAEVLKDLPTYLPTCA